MVVFTSTTIVLISTCTSVLIRTNVRLVLQVGFEMEDFIAQSSLVLISFLHPPPGDGEIHRKGNETYPPSDVGFQENESIVRWKRAKKKKINGGGPSRRGIPSHPRRVREGGRWGDGDKRRDSLPIWKGTVEGIPRRGTYRVVSVQTGFPSEWTDACRRHPWRDSFFLIRIHSLSYGSIDGTGKTSPSDCD